MTDEKLKPCPFCGGEAMINGITLVYIKCTKRGVETVGYREEDEAVEAWNRRVIHDNGEILLLRHAGLDVRADRADAVRGSGAEGNQQKDEQEER